jgi:hypothetical protein
MIQFSNITIKLRGPDGGICTVTKGICKLPTDVGTAIEKKIYKRKNGGKEAPKKLNG